MIGYHISKSGFFVTVFGGLSSYFVWKFGFEASTGVNPMLIGLGVNFAIYMVFLYLRRYPKFAAKTLPPAARMVSSEDFKKKPSKFNLGLFCSFVSNPGVVVKSWVNKVIADQDFNLKLNIDSRQYKTLGIINLMLYFMPFTLILDDIASNSQAMHIMLVKITTVFFGVILLLHELYPKNIKRILPFCWYMVLMFNMSAVPCYFLFISDATISSLAVFGLSSLVLLVILQWYEFVIVSIFGLVVGFLACTFLKQHQFYFILPNIYYYEFINIYIFLSVTCYILIRNKEYLRVATTTRLKKEVANKTAYLMEALEVKQRILNNISHEIRTPLHGVMSLSGLAYDLWPKLSEAERKSYLQKIVTNGDRLMSLVSNLLDISKLDSSSMIFNKDCNNLVTIINEVIGEFDGVYQDFKTSLDISKFTAYDKLSLFDYHRISQVIRNLLSNAYKYGDKQTAILLELRDYVYKYDDVEILGAKFSVSNKGIGIPEDELEIIFDAFTESSRTRKVSGGTGLGLAICKEIVESHDGLIYARNRADGYTEIGFTLPQFSDAEYAEYIDDKKILDAAIDASRTREKTSKNTTLKEPEQDLDQDHKLPASNSEETKEALKQTQTEILSDKSKPNVLIIDDEDIVLSSCSLIMRSLGFKIYTANGGLSALEQLGINQASGMENTETDSNTQTQQATESLEIEQQQPQKGAESTQAKQPASELGQVAEATKNTDLLSSTMPHAKKSASEASKPISSEQNLPKFDLILLDLMMPDIYGGEILKQIRASANTRDIPVIVQSGIADDNEISKIYNIGANYFISKPYGKDKITHALAKIKFKI
jgi:signal transduction histidine kinase/CheY-like chemotaxis protein